MKSIKKLNTEVVALVGPPNAGKTTLFNWLTNRKYKTVNYPGATVEYSIASLAPQWGVNFTVMDTPGTYSLHPKSEDEEVTFKALFHHIELGAIRDVIVVVDGTQLSRHLNLVWQLKHSGFYLTIAVTMSDLISKSGYHIDIAKLSETFSCPVVLVDGLLGGGIKELVEKTQFAREQKKNETSERLPNPQVLKQTQEEQIQILQQMNELSLQVVIQNEASTLKNLNSNSNSSSNSNLNLTSKPESFISNTSLERENSKTSPVFPLLERTQKWDRWLLHPVLGLFFFILIMSGLFTSIFFFAAPFMDAIDGFFSDFASKVAEVGGATLWSDFLGNGIVTSFGAVFVFVPQIFILFFLIGFMESTGYLSRAATLIDRPLSFFGMSGRSFVPLLSGFACAVPAIMATRNISSKRTRFITMMVVPLMTCSARLPVYALLLAFLFRDKPAWQAGIGLTVLYMGGLIAGAIVSQFLHRILKTEKNAFFMMELPLYRQPKLSVVLNQAWTKTMGYIKRAGPSIFTFALLVWVATTFPNYQAEKDQVKLESSYAGQLGQYIEPVFKPMGVDWRVGVSLISAFAAREVFASSLAVIFNVTTEDEESMQAGLLSSMTEAKDASGRFIFSTASVIGLMLFVMIALQCTSTTAIVIRETGKISWAIIQVIAYNLLAYVVAVGVYQVWN